MLGTSPKDCVDPQGASEGNILSASLAGFVTDRQKRSFRIPFGQIEGLLIHGPESEVAP